MLHSSARRGYEAERPVLAREASFHGVMDSADFGPEVLVPGYGVTIGSCPTHPRI